MMAKACEVRTVDLEMNVACVVSTKMDAVLVLNFLDQEEDSSKAKSFGCINASKTRDRDSKRKGFLYPLSCIT